MTGYDILLHVSNNNVKKKQKSKLYKKGAPEKPRTKATYSPFNFFYFTISSIISATFNTALC